MKQDNQKVTESLKAIKKYLPETIGDYAVFILTPQELAERNTYKTAADAIEWMLERPVDPNQVAYVIYLEHRDTFSQIQHSGVIYIDGTIDIVGIAFVQMDVAPSALATTLFDDAVFG